MDERINLNKLNVFIKDINKLSPEEFTNARRSTLGASDSAAVLGLYDKWRTSTDIIEEKIQKGISEKELAIGMKPAVRMGASLEPFVLDTLNRIGFSVDKPTDMYTLKDFPYLSVNYDGIHFDSKACMAVPVECKVVTAYGEKNYNPAAAIFEYDFREIVKDLETPSVYCAEHYTKHWITNTDIVDKAATCGIPTYYYAQLQQQLMGLSSNYGLLVALHIKDWMLRMYIVPNDTKVQYDISLKGYETYCKIQKLKGEH